MLATFEEDMCYERRPGQGESAIAGCTKKSLLSGGESCAFVVQTSLMAYPAADIAIHNGGGCGTDILEGTFSYDAAAAMIPFDNTLMSIALTGSQIKAVLEDAISAGDETSGGYPYAAGLRFDVDMSAAIGSRVSNVMVNKKLASRRFAPLSMTKTCATGPTVSLSTTPSFPRQFLPQHVPLLT